MLTWDASKAVSWAGSLLYVPLVHGILSSSQCTIVVGIPAKTICRRVVSGFGSADRSDMVAEFCRTRQRRLESEYTLS